MSRGWGDDPVSKALALQVSGFVFRSLASTQKLGLIVLVSKISARSRIQAGAWSSLASKFSEVVRDCEMVRRPNW